MRVYQRELFTCRYGMAALLPGCDGTPRAPLLARQPHWWAPQLDACRPRARQTVRWQGIGSGHGAPREACGIPGRFVRFPARGMAPAARACGLAPRDASRPGEAPEVCGTLAHSQALARRSLRARGSRWQQVVKPGRVDRAGRVRFTTRHVSSAELSRIEPFASPPSAGHARGAGRRPPAQNMDVGKPWPFSKLMAMSSKVSIHVHKAFCSRDSDSPRPQR